MFVFYFYWEDHVSSGSEVSAERHFVSQFNAVQYTKLALFTVFPLTNSPSYDFSKLLLASLLCVHRLMIFYDDFQLTQLHLLHFTFYFTILSCQLGKHCECFVISFKFFLFQLSIDNCFNSRKLFFSVTFTFSIAPALFSLDTQQNNFFVLVSENSNFNIPLIPNWKRITRAVRFFSKS